MVNRRLQVLVADDDKDDQGFIEEAIKLTKIDSSVRAFFDGSELLEFLKKIETGGKSDRADVIILDINMRHVGGIAALKTIRQDKNLNHIPVFILSTTSDPDSINECLRLGASGFFTKPNSILDYTRIALDILSQCSTNKELCMTAS